jgi:hypothetical protein
MGTRGVVLFEKPSEIRLKHNSLSEILHPNKLGLRMTGQRLSRAKNAELIIAIRIFCPCYNWDERKQWAKRLQSTILR